MAVPHVLVSHDGRIAGYYTLSSANIRLDDFPDELQVRLPKYPTLGATLIGRLARDLNFRGQGVGELLLIDALKVALMMSRKIASVAVVVDAKNDNARHFYTKLGFVAFSAAANKLFLRMEAIERLFPTSVS